MQYAFSSDRSLKNLIMKCYISKKLKSSFENAEEQTIEALKKEGFGVLTEIDYTCFGFSLKKS